MNRGEQKTVEVNWRLQMMLAQLAYFFRQANSVAVFLALQRELIEARAAIPNKTASAGTGPSEPPTEPPEPPPATEGSAAQEDARPVIPGTLGMAARSLKFLRVELRDTPNDQLLPAVREAVEVALQSGLDNLRIARRNLKMKPLLALNYLQAKLNLDQACVHGRTIGHALVEPAGNALKEVLGDPPLVRRAGDPIGPDDTV